MRFKKVSILLILVVFVTTSFFSCKIVKTAVYQINKEVDNDSFWNKFSEHNIPTQKIFFVKSPQQEDVNFKYEFLKSFHQNINYIYFGSGYSLNDDIYFKTINSKKNGCNEVLVSLVEENEYPFFVNDEIRDLFQKFSFYNSEGTKFKLSRKKTVILIHNSSEGNLFFKDASKIINFVKSNDQFDYVILTTNFYDFNLKKVVP